ncbi:hypothetical protein [Planctomyces sp. SH-PL62]|uniref:hypothetical protein n=1 Tax=Planctomyces sp. SH-PL62 TaxID=1636152 RepID=UPI00078B1F29|nr:hypothetical protein [Planctomyces sp. SH-PL62]AMV40499.1 hypothetical protein VT85_23920 [Planctomyces sp. SH-PL62]
MMTEDIDAPDGGEGQPYDPSEEDLKWAAEHLNDEDWFAAHGEVPTPEDGEVELAYYQGCHLAESYGDWMGREAERLARELAIDGDEDEDGDEVVP